MKAIKSLAATFLALVLLCGAAFGIGWGITGTYDVTKWFKSQPDEGNGGDGSLVVTPEEGNYVKLAVKPLSEEGAFVVTEEADGNGAVSYSSSNGISITATVYMPDGSTPAELQNVVWEISNPEAGVTMTVNGTTATFETSGFSEQITVTCRSRFDLSKYTTVTLDYARRPVDMRLQLFDNDFIFSDTYRHGTGGSMNYINMHIPYTDYAREAMEGVPFYENKSLYFCCGLVFDNSTSVVRENPGTVDNEVKNITVNVNLREDVKKSLEHELGQREFNEITLSYNGQGMFYYGISLMDLIGEDGLMKLSEAEYEGENDVYGKYLTKIAKTQELLDGPKIKVNVTVDLKYGGQVTYDYGITLYLDYEVDSVELDGPSSIII